MRVYPIKDGIATKYKGSGYALAAVAGNEIVGIVYLRDVDINFDGGKRAAEKLMMDERIAPFVRELSALGEVFVGMCSSWEFVVL